MFRLFLSLYLAVVVGLLTINWGSELLWRYLMGNHLAVSSSSEEHPQLSIELQHSLALAKSLPALIQQDKNKLKTFSQHSGIDLAILSMNDIAWLATQQQQLETGQALVTYNQDDSIYIYTKAGNSQYIYQLGPMFIQQQDSRLLKYVILTISYLLLAAFIALWTRPIWQDLMQLQTMAERIAKGDLEIMSQVNTRSPTAIVVQTFADMAKRITRLLLDQKQLVNAVSHELRTPLARIKFSLAMLPESSKEQVVEISTDVDEMEKLIDEMLGYSRIEHLDQQPNKSMVNITELLINHVEKLQRATDKLLQLTVDDNLVYLCHGDLVERACQNLITNAIRYAKQQVNISAMMKNDKLHIAVSDDGCGISQADKDKVFNAFTRLDKSRNKEKGGFGLGLAIVKRIVDLHHGQCTVEDSSSGGCTFTLMI